MSKLEIFSALLSVVSEVTEVSVSDIMSGCRKEEVVDARMILARCLTQEGLYPSQIAALMGQTTRNVNRALTALDDRLTTSFNLRNNLESVRKKAGMM